MSRSTLVAFALGCAAASLVVIAPLDARACGGCFHEETPTPTQSPSVITDHRMALAISPTLTTLWDQVEYAGDPQGFAWVLPIRGRVVVGIGSDNFLGSLDQQTQPLIKAPPSSCPAPTFDYGGGGGSGCGSSGAMKDEATPTDNASGGGTGWQEDSGVYVTDRSTVGPYETVQVHGADAGGILAWLQKNHYVVPDALKPMLQKYVDEGFDFVAVRLRPGFGVTAMRPIRVSFRGAYPTLPLRMVRAGVGDKVGIKLFVIGDGRWKTSNFPTFVIDPASLVWDWSIQRSNYTTIRDASAGNFDSRAFAMESSVVIVRTSLPPAEAFPDAGRPTDDAAATTDAAADVVDASETTATDAASDVMLDDATSDASDEAASDAADDAATADAAATDASSADASDAASTPPDYDAGPAPAVDPDASDIEIAFGTYSARRVTRLRADLKSKYLDVDLDLQADDVQSPLSPALQVQRGVNEVCPTYASPASSSSGACDCNVPSSSRALPVPLAICAAAIAAALLRRRP